MGEVKKHQNNHKSPKNHPNSPKNSQKSPQNMFLLCVTIIPDWGEPFQVFESSQYLSSGQSYRNSPKIPQKRSKIPQNTKCVSNMCHLCLLTEENHFRPLNHLNSSVLAKVMAPPRAETPKIKNGAKKGQNGWIQLDPHFFGLFIP